MNCDVGEARKCWRMSCYVGKATEGLEFLRTLFSNTCNLFSSLKVRVHVSLPYNITGRITVLYILSLMFFERSWDDKSPCNA